jgi:hypothetical protein
MDFCPQHQLTRAYLFNSGFTVVSDEVFIEEGLKEEL